MRLTLRTLLAYLDDVLDPNAAREIGAKLGESPVAASIVERIKDILKRRRIAAPDVSGPGSKPDPNLIAEYLDNTLIGSDVEDVERICLDSDLHLAEVAACHKILTLVLGEPVEIPRATREQMYALGAAMPSEQAGSSVTPVTGPNGSQQRATLSPPTELPEELKRPRSTGTLLVAALVLIVFGAWIGLVINDHGLLDFGDDDQAVDSTVAVNDGEDPANIIVEAQGDSEEESDEDAVSDSDSETNEVVEPEDVEAADASEELTDADINPPAPDDADADVESAIITEIPETDMPEVIDPVPEVLEDPDGEAVVVVPAEETDEPQPVVSGSPIQILYVSHEEVLLQQQLGELPGWFVLARNSEIRDGQVIACPEPFEAELQVSGAMCRVDLVGGTLLRSLGTSVDAAFQFALDRGALVVRHTGLANDPSTSFRLLVSDKPLHFELSSGSILGVQLERLPPTGRDADAIPVSVSRLTVFIPQGSCIVTDESGEQLDLVPEVNGLLTWRSDVNVFIPQVLQAAPAWYTASIRERTGAARQTARLYEDMFLIGQPVESTLPTVVRHDEQRFAELAVSTLGLIGDYPQLVKALRSDKEFAILAAARELAIWLPMAAENGGLLHDELLRDERDPDDPAVLENVTIMEELLWGYDETDAIDPGVSQRLVEWLLHPDLAVRLIAFSHVRGITGITQNYQPTAPQRQLEISVDNWRAHLRRNGGALIEPPVVVAPE